jgi:endoglucanase
VIYGTHIYPWKRDWDAHLASAAARYPVFVGEVGCEPDPKQEDPFTWAPRVLAYLQEHAWSWTAWCFHPSASPRLLANWSYTPTPYWGAFVKKALREMRRPA